MAFPQHQAGQTYTHPQGVPAVVDSENQRGAIGAVLGIIHPHAAATLNTLTLDAINGSPTNFKVNEQFQFLASPLKALLICVGQGVGPVSEMDGIYSTTYTDTMKPQVIGPNRQIRARTSERWRIDYFTLSMPVDNRRREL